MGSSARFALLLVLPFLAATPGAQAQTSVRGTCSAPKGPPPCKDTDGDGLCDSWEHAKRLPSGEPLPDADPDRPDIYLQYAYMGWAKPGAACAQDLDCANGGLTPNDVCHENRCNHNHKPDPRALEIVVAAFARHGVALHIDPNPQEVPHSEVITWARAADPGNGGKAICAGADLVPGALGGFAVSLFDIKDRYFDPARKLAYHYTVFGHFNTCLTDTPGALVGNCTQCPTDRSTPSGNPAAGSSGTAEVPGNDFIVSLGQSFYNPFGSVKRSPFVEAGVFMHELGHNLGLHHAGDVPTPVNAPNYLSVMNGRYVFSGILQSDGVGSSTLKTCSTDGDCSGGALCRPAPAGGGLCTRIDFSSSTLNTLNESSLDEGAGVSPLSSGLRDIITWWDEANFTNRRGAAAGAVDWTGNGVIDGQPVSMDLNGESGSAEVMRGYDDWDHGACNTSADCRINAIRLAIHDLIDPSVDPHEECIQNRCQAQWRAFQCTPWGKAD